MKHAALDHLRSNFVAIAENCREMGLDACHAHLARIQGMQSSELKRLLYTCSFCILQKPSWTLDCGHLLCRSCVVAHGMCDEDHRSRLTSCPVCQSPNLTSFIMKPPTASAITLKLAGTSPVKIMQFLLDLRRAIGIPLKDCFDIVAGSGIGKLPNGIPTLKQS
jgi:hypothetical protein